VFSIGAYIKHLKEGVLYSEGVQHLIWKAFYELLRMAVADKSFCSTWQREMEALEA